MKQISLIAGKILYGVVFLVLIPVILWCWAKFTSHLIPFPAIESKPVGWILMITGGLLMLWGMFALMHFGKGMPMNAFPPSIFVTQGPYRLFRHPIYWGFGILLVGYFVFSGSASGLWLVSPLTILGMIALVLGHESLDLKKRFPNQTIRTVLDYPENKTDSPDIRDRLTSLFWVGSLLVISNFVMGKFFGNVQPLYGKPLQFFTSINNQNLILLSILFVITVPLWLKRRDDLREWEISAFIALSCSAFIGLMYPEIGAQYLLPKGSVLFSVPIFLILISLRIISRHSGKIAFLFILTAAILVVIQLISSRSAPLHLAVSLLIYFLSAFNKNIWLFLKNTAEKIANSWKEWTFGKIRVINHGFYVGIGVFLGILYSGFLVGKEYSIALLVYVVLLTIFGALWAQIIEGSEKLKRPFGYYGGIFGIIFGSFAVWLMDLNVWVIIGVTSIVMPWGQAMGRLRCLVNGCCHGSRVDNPSIGIRFLHPRSRVCNISGLKGELLHPTQLYSILWLFFVGLFLIALWHKKAPLSLIFGLYLILTSLGRFVEEAYRGEVQTPIIKGLRLYQWTAIFTLAIGIIMTFIKIEPVVFTGGFNWEIFGVAAFCGIFVFFAMGVDFPYSNARFSRLV